jgi:muramoyltetrapeptide carboxypeptidase LdcA involved in peptidoglycan recycling
MKEIILPREFEPRGKIRIIFPSSALIGREDHQFKKYVDYFYSKFPHRVKVLRKSRRDPVVSHLAAPLAERKKLFLQAVSEGDLIMPAVGGTGMGDIIDSFTEKELDFIAKKKPIFCGFSDFSGFNNFIYFKRGLVSFCYVNAWNLFKTNIRDKFFDLMEGKLGKIEYVNKLFHWLENRPEEKIEGIAIGGTLLTLVNLLDRPETLIENWKNHILFIEDTKADLEDLHLAINSLKRRNVFQEIECLVLGELGYYPVPGHLRDFPKKFAQQEKYINKVFLHLIEDELEKRDKAKRPLPILKINNFGHDVQKNNLILPVGGRITISPSKKITIHGPFVK